MKRKHFILCLQLKPHQLYDAVQAADKHDWVSYALTNAPLVGLAGLAAGVHEAYLNFEVGWSTDLGNCCTYACVTIKCSMGQLPQNCCPCGADLLKCIAKSLCETSCARSLRPFPLFPGLSSCVAIGKHTLFTLAEDASECLSPAPQAGQVPVWHCWQEDLVRYRTGRRVQRN